MAAQMIHNHFSVILKNSTCENMLQWPFHRAWWVSKNTTTYKDSSQPFTCVKTLHREQIKAPAQPQTPQHSRDTGKKQWKWLQLSTNPKERKKGEYSGMEANFGNGGLARENHSFRRPRETYFAKSPRRQVFIYFRWIHLNWCCFSARKTQRAAI